MNKSKLLHFNSNITHKNKTTANSHQTQLYIAKKKICSDYKNLEIY